MAPHRGSATSFVLATLRTYADRELRAHEFFALADGRHSQGSLNSALYALEAQALVVRIKDEGLGAVWWAITAKGLALPAPSKAKKK